MLWLVYALLAALFAGVKNAIHRYIMKTYHPYSYALLENIMASLVFLPLFIIYFELPVQLLPWVLVIVSSICWAAIMPLVFLSHKHTEASLRAPINQMVILFVFVFSFILLAEKLTVEKILGTVIMFIGLIIISYHKNNVFGKWSDRGVQLTLLSTFLLSFILIIDKIAMNYFVPEVYIFLIYAFPALFLLPFIKKRIEPTKHLLKTRPLFLIIIGFLGLSYLMLLKAYKLADISLVYPVSRISILITMGIGFTLHKERGEILKRLIGAIIMIFGAVLIAGAFTF